MYKVRLQEFTDGLSTDIYTVRVLEVIKEGGFLFYLNLELPKLLLSPDACPKAPQSWDTTFLFLSEFSGHFRSPQRWQKKILALSCDLTGNVWEFKSNVSKMCLLVCIQICLKEDYSSFQLGFYFQSSCHHFCLFWLFSPKSLPDLRPQWHC